MKLQRQSAEKLTRFMKLIPKGGDETLITLKGHLLVEELLTEILIKRLGKHNPLGIEISSRMMFNQKLNYCWSLIQNELSNDLWISLKKLNSIRNKMAHAVEPEGITSKIDSFTNMVMNSSGYAMPETNENKLEYSLAWLYILLNEHLHNEQNS